MFDFREATEVEAKLQKGTAVGVFKGADFQDFAQTMDFGDVVLVLVRLIGGGLELQRLILSRASEFHEKPFQDHSGRECGGPFQIEVGLQEFGGQAGHS